MKMQWVMNLTVVMLMSMSLSAQVVSKDSLTSLKNQKESIELSKKINEQKIELAKLENEITGKTLEADQTAEKAKSAAEANVQAADNLTNDAQDKQLSKKAGKSAGTASRDAKKARKAADNLDGLKKNIDSLKSKIAEEEAKLAAMP